MMNTKDEELGAISLWVRGEDIKPGRANRAIRITLCGSGEEVSVKGSEKE
jgi:hypothetical protein